MTEHDKARREFLVRAVVSAGAVAGAGLAPSADAQTHERHKEAGGAEHAAPDANKQRAFFNFEDAPAIAAFTERLMPGAPGKPGARDADVLNYIDLALAGAYADLQDFYRSGLLQLDGYCRKNYKEPFARLSETQQDEVLQAMEQGKATGFSWPTAQAFFETLRVHTMEGMFADPLYGGNRDFVGWRLVGFPGAQENFTQADMKSRKDF